MKESFRLTQLYKSGTERVMATCHVNDTEDGDRFECRIQGDDNFKDALFRYFSDEHHRFGKNGRNVDVEFTDVNSIGLPKDGCVVWIYGFSEVFNRP